METKEKNVPDPDADQQKDSKAENTKGSCRGDGQGRGLGRGGGQGRRDGSGGGQGRGGGGKGGRRKG